MTYTYIPKGVCSRKIDLTIEDGVIRNVKFSGGCSGNTQGVAALCIGRRPEECLMVGNDVGEDMVVRQLGMQVFLLTDCLINRQGEDLSAYPSGGFPELKDFLSRL